MKTVDKICVPGGSEDLSQLQYPFIIAALLNIVVVLFAKLKKKAIFKNGKLKMVSQQNSISSISAFVAPLQTLAIMTQWAFSLYYGYMIHCILGLVLTVIQVILNASFLIWFYRRFMLIFSP